jgi:hypothetical protein
VKEDEEGENFHLEMSMEGARSSFHFMAKHTNLIHLGHKKVNEHKVAAKGTVYKLL